jgi:hypothetical protein
MFLIHTSHENAGIVARAVTSACRVEGWQSPVQRRFNIQPKSAKILELDPFGAMKLPPVK